MFPNDRQNFPNNQNWGYATPTEQDAIGVASEPLDTDIPQQTTSSTSAALHWNRSVEIQAANTTQSWFYGQLEGMGNDYGDQWPPQSLANGNQFSTDVDEYAGHRGALHFSTSTYSSLSWALGGNTYNLPFQPDSPPSTPVNNAASLSGTPTYSMPAAPISSSTPHENNNTENADSSSSSALYNQSGRESPRSANHLEPAFSARIAPAPSSTAGPITHVQPPSGHLHSQDWIDRGYPRMAPQPSSSNPSADDFGTIVQNVPLHRPNLPELPDRSSSSVQHVIHSGMQASSSGPMRRRAERRSNRSSTVDDATVEELRRLEYGRGSRRRRNRNGSGRSGATFTVGSQPPQASKEASNSTSVASTGRPASFRSNWSIVGTRNYMGDELIPPIPPSGGSSETSAYAEKQHNSKEKSKCTKRSRVDCKTPIKKLDKQKILRTDIRRYVRNIQDVLFFLGDTLAYGYSEGDALAALIPSLGGTIVPQRDMSFTLKAEKNVEYRRFKKACIKAVYMLLANQSGEELEERTIWEEVVRILRDRYPWA